MKCPLCGYEFTEAGMKKAKCGGCPIVGECEVLCCPHCGYQCIGESRTANFVRRLFKWRKK